MLASLFEERIINTMSGETSTTSRLPDILRRPVGDKLGRVALVFLLGFMASEATTRPNDAAANQTFITTDGAYVMKNPDLWDPGNTSPLPKGEKVTAACYVSPGWDESGPTYLYITAKGEYGETEKGFVSTQMIAPVDSKGEILVGDCSEELGPGY